MYCGENKSNKQSAISISESKNNTSQAISAINRKIKENSIEETREKNISIFTYR